MIEVQANLLPHGRRDISESLGTVKIRNDGTGTAARGNYEVTLYSRGKVPRQVRTARVENWPRNAKTSFDLVIAAIKALGKKDAL